MLFNSIEFLLFLPIVFLLYWFVFNRNLKAQNFFVLAASFVFYGWWDWRFLSLVIFSSLVDYLVGVGLGGTQDSRKRKLLLLTSIVINLGFLGFFKYYNFFAESFASAFTLFGQPFTADRLKIVLPVGISFYTFQTMSYSIDVYRRKLEPTKDLVAFFAYVSFFPQLVAGPIERATNLLPQFLTPRSFRYAQAVDGMRQILWGLFKKIVIADNCATYTNKIFDHYPDYNGSTLLLGALFFAFQIYGDFSGYSDIAIGTSRLFGFTLMRNFAFPYFSRDIAEFWRRWHISLTTWFRDYVYIPLGGSQGTKNLILRNTIIIFLLSGLWHGASWTFVAWGLINALYFIPLLLQGMNRKHTDIVAQGKLIPSVKEFTQISATFFITIIAWVFFRAESLTDAFRYIGKVFSTTLFSIPQIRPLETFAMISLLVVAEWLQREKQHALQLDGMKMPRVVRWAVYYGLVGAMAVFGGAQQEFIYFQF